MCDFLASKEIAAVESVVGDLHRRYPNAATLACVNAAKEVQQSQSQKNEDALLKHLRKPGAAVGYQYQWELHSRCDGGITRIVKSSGGARYTFLCDAIQAALKAYIPQAHVGVNTFPILHLRAVGHRAPGFDAIRLLHHPTSQTALFGDVARLGCRDSLYPNDPVNRKLMHKRLCELESETDDVVDCGSPPTLFVMHGR